MFAFATCLRLYLRRTAALCLASALVAPCGTGGAVRAAQPPGPLATVRPAAVADVRGHFVLQRQEYGYWTHFLLQDELGATFGLVERRHWRQPWRRQYALQNLAGQPRAWATQPIFTASNLFSWGAIFNLTGEDPAASQGGSTVPLGRLVGRLWTLQTAAYTLYDAQQQKLAEVAIDDFGQSVVFRQHAGGEILATFLREQQATGGGDRWNVHVERDVGLSPDAWALMAAFFADVWTDLARQRAP